MYLTQAKTQATHLAHVHEISLLLLLVALNLQKYNFKWSYSI